MEPNATPPSRRDIHAALLWCARWRMGDGEQYLGPIKVEIVAKKKAEKIIVEPRNSRDGLTLPPALGVPPSAKVSAVELLLVLLSPDEEKILRLCVRNPQALVSDIHRMTGFANSKFYTLWRNLRDRKLVARAERGQGFAILHPWLPELLDQLDKSGEVRLSAQDGG